MNSINLKFFCLLFIFLFKNINSRRSCKTDILRSFTLHGRITPDKTNVLCPNVEWNCCTTHD